MTTITTVLGEIPADELGHTQTHEHVAFDGGELLAAPGFVFHFDDRRQMLTELRRYRELGGGALVDVTPVDLGRDPVALAELSKDSGVHIVMGCGWYRHAAYGPFVEATPTAGLAEHLIHEIERGVEGTGIRPGIIGEIGTDRAWLKPSEERVFRAAARAHAKTGTPVTTHTTRGAAQAQYAILREEGMDPSRLVFGHCDNTLIIEYHEWMLSTGAYVQFDLVGIEWINSDERRIEVLGELVRRGHEHRLLLSLDICYRHRLWTNGGSGYGFLLENFLPRLRQAGIDENTLYLIMVANPRRVLEH